MLVISDDVRIPLSEFDISFSRSGGPGGQNVNKVNSKAELRWVVAASSSLPEDVRERFIARYRSRLTLDGDFILTSQRFRDQARNVDDCLNKLKDMIAAVLAAPTPRRPTRPTQASLRRRAQAKRQQSQKKEQRRPPGLEY